MDRDYGNGRYVLYGQEPNGPKVGYAENGFVQSGTGTWQFRLDGTEVYGAGGDLVGFIEDGVASRPNGQFLFRIEPD